MNLGRIHWYGHDSFRIEDGGKQLYIDPWEMPAGLPKADVIFVTHDHYDHYSQPDVEALSRPGTRVVAPPDTAAKVGDAAVAVRPGESIDVEGLKVTAVPAYNVGKKFHPKHSGWVGYVITLSDGTRVYHAGDADHVPEMDSLEVDVALLPVSGTYVMTAEEAIAAANAMKPEVAIPMHYGTIVGDARDAEKFQKGFTGKTVIKKPEK